MAAITANNPTEFQMKYRESEGMTLLLPVAASTTIYRNTLVGVNIQGYLVSYIPWSQGLALNGSPFVGIAIENVNNSAGSNADKSCNVFVDGYVEYPLSGAATHDIGKPVFGLDNATLTKLHVPAALATGGGYELIGRIVAVPSTGIVVVNIASPLARSGYGNGLLVKTRRIDVANVVNDKIYLVHETENHNGLYLVSVNGLITEAVVSTGGAAQVTIQYTLAGSDTSLGCTIDFANAAPVADLVVGAGGVFTGVTAADADNLVLIPADRAVSAEVTTVANGGVITGAADLTAMFAIR